MINSYSFSNIQNEYTFFIINLLLQDKTIQTKHKKIGRRENNKFLLLLYIKDFFAAALHSGDHNSH